MKSLWIVLALSAILVVGCKSADSGDKSASNSPAATAGDTPKSDAAGAPDATAPKSDGDAPKTDAPAAGAGDSALTGNWTGKDEVGKDTTMDFKDDGTMSINAMSGPDRMTMMGTYKVGGPSKGMPDGKDVKLTVSEIKMDDPSKQPEADKGMKTMLDMINSTPAAAFKIESDGALSMMMPGSSKVTKFTKKTD